jgi:hypothetical protein
MILVSCQAQNTKQKSNHQKKEMTTEKFDIKKFEKNQVNGNYSFVLENGYSVKQFYSGLNSSKIYLEYYFTPEKKHFYLYKEFYFNGILKTVGFRNKISSFQIGIWKTYNKKGELIEEINYDEPFDFSFEQVLELLKKEKDLIDPYNKNTNISRGIDGDKPIWEVSYRKEYGRRETIIIDGKTGEIIERDFYLHEDN